MRNLHPAGATRNVHAIYIEPGPSSRSGSVRSYQVQFHLGEESDAIYVTRMQVEREQEGRSTVLGAILVLTLPSSPSKVSQERWYCTPSESRRVVAGGGLGPQEQVL